jgi:predicted nucleic acid-binding protein
MRVALDTNILVYAEGVNGVERSQRARAVLVELAADDIVIPIQALGELFAVLTRKAHWTAAAARGAVLAWHDSHDTVATSPAVLFDAMELVTSHRLSFWDAIMLAAAAHSGCRLLISEDMQDGFTWRGVTIRNPFDGVGKPAI